MGIIWNEGVRYHDQLNKWLGGDVGGLKSTYKRLGWTLKVCSCDVSSPLPRRVNTRYSILVCQRIYELVCNMCSHKATTQTVNLCCIHSSVFCI